MNELLGLSVCVQLKLDSRQHQHKLKSTASVVRFKSVSAAKLMSSWLKLQLVSKSLQSARGRVAKCKIFFKEKTLRA